MNFQPINLSAHPRTQDKQNMPLTARESGKNYCIVALQNYKSYKRAL